MENQCAANVFLFVYGNSCRMFISHWICVLTWSVVHVSCYDYVSTNESSYLMINHNTAGRHSSMCEQMHRRGLEMDEGSKGPQPWRWCPTGRSVHHPPAQQRLRPRARSEGGCRSAGQHFLRQISPQGGHFYSHGVLSEDGRLLETYGIHLKKWSRDIFANRLAKLVRRHLTKEWWEREIADHN